MSLLVDPAAIDNLARRVALEGADARTRAALLTRAATAAGWHGPAAAVFADRAQRSARALHLAADRLDSSARALHRHARVVEQRLAAVGAIAAGAERAVDDLVGGVAHLAGL